MANVNVKRVKSSEIEFTGEGRIAFSAGSTPPEHLALRTGRGYQPNQVFSCEIHHEHARSNQRDRICAKLVHTTLDFYRDIVRAVLGIQAHRSWMVTPVTISPIIELRVVYQVGHHPISKHGLKVGVAWQRVQCLVNPLQAVCRMIR